MPSQHGCAQDVSVPAANYTRRPSALDVCTTRGVGRFGPACWTPRLAVGHAPLEVAVVALELHPADLGGTDPPLVLMRLP